MKQPTKNTFQAAFDRVIEDDKWKDKTPFLYTRIMQAVENSHDEEKPFLPPLFSRFAIASIVIFLTFNLLFLLEAPDCPPSVAPQKNTQMETEDPYANGINYDNITDILLNQ